MNPKNNLLALALFAALASHAQVRCQWLADTARPSSVTFVGYHGETLWLEPAFTSYGQTIDLSDASATLYWQTNGMDSVWWSKPATVIAGDPDRVRAIFAPTNDAGATAYSFFVGLTSTNGRAFRALGTLQMRSSPGWDATTLPNPDAWPTLAADILSVMLPALPTYAAWTNEAALRAAADAALQAQITALDGGGSSSSALQSDAALRLISADSNLWLSVESGTATLFTATATNWIALPPEYASLWPGSGSQAFPFKGFGADIWTGFVAKSNAVGLYDEGDVVLSLDTSGGVPHVWSAPSSLAAELSLPAKTSGTLGTATLYRVISGGTATHTYTTEADLAAALASYNPAVATQALSIAQAAWSTATNNASSLSISTQALAVAQSSLGVASANAANLVIATNVIVQTYFVSSNAWITADFSNATLGVTMVIDGLTNTVIVEAAGASIDPAATNALWLALAANNSALTAAIAAKADKAWGQYAPDGSANPDPDYMVWLNTPAVTYAAGLTWTTYGTYAALSTSGTVAFESGADGALHIGPDSTNWFGFVTGGSVTVGATPGTLTVTDGGTSNGVAAITFPYTSGDFPTLWFTSTLSLDFDQVSGVVWIDNTNGSATVTAPATTATGFWRASTSVSYDSYFATSMPAKFSGGIFGATNSTPIIYDSTVTITSGAKTYRIPAQLVE